MALTPEIRATQARTFAAEAGGEIRVTEGRALAAMNFPTVQMRITQARVYVAGSSDDNSVQVTQARVFAATRGRVANSTVQNWTFTLDGHDFYVLRLGDDETLIYDMSTEQWVDWSDRDNPFWRARYGINWEGAQGLAQNYGSNILIGDDTFGLLWLLDPDQPFDQHPDYLAEEQQIYFERVVMGQVALRGRETVPVFAAWITSDLGAPAYTGAGVTLLTSDDAGKTYDDHGAVTVVLNDFDAEISWYSLGQMTAPGRLFKIVDNGAVARIDGLEVNDK